MAAAELIRSGFGLLLKVIEKGLSHVILSATTPFLWSASVCEPLWKSVQQLKAAYEWSVL